MATPVKESYMLYLKDARVSTLRMMLATMGFPPQVKELEPLKVELQTATNEMVELIGAATMRVSYSRWKALDSDVEKCKTKMEVQVVAVQAVRKMLEVARVADAKDEARVRESQLRMNSPKKMKLDDRLEIQPTKTEAEETKSDDRIGTTRSGRTSYEDRSRRTGTRWSIGTTKGGSTVQDVGRTE